MPRLLPLVGPLKGLVRDGAPRLRSTAAVFTSMTALAAMSLVTGPALAEAGPAPCALRRTEAHHSEGLDSWNADYPRPTRPFDAVMVFLSFPDGGPETTPAELADDYFPATDRFFARASYGRFSLRTHPLRQWIRMPHPSTAYAISRDWSPGRRAAYLRDALAAADRHVDFSRYDVVYFVADPDAPGVDSDATKVVNLDRPLRADGKDIRRVVTVFERHPPDRLVLAHETGHVFDLPDLYHRPVDGRGDWDTYVGDWDLMGSQFGLAPDLFAWHKWKLGWLDPRQVVCVKGPGSTRLTLEPVDAGPAPGDAGAPAASDATGAVGTSDLSADATGAAGAPGVAGTAGAPASVPVSVPGIGVRPLAVAGRGTKLAVVRTGRDRVLAVEARDPVGNDAAACTRGILVYRIRNGAESGDGPVQVVDAHPHTEACRNESVYPPLADAPVFTGETFTVPGEGVRVTVEGRTASGEWTVDITTGTE
ncbi:M6 family metalloprotease domain-containing protein [Streptomyces sp. B3I8]|uniref:M6 family metalloprotease domain-containing protein n=1 Tax=Streptomyces sp. B3I8 TaxID=3042303 RepID=UPI00278672CD|nr:M6 family metalloprotease domain-containing protein [Streptomyces sp. B3I8]MDQ0787155.1 M6 family metalloprotease-like protein [Streptomyces sp. B3I8]